MTGKTTRLLKNKEMIRAMLIFSFHICKVKRTLQYVIDIPLRVTRGSKLATGTYPVLGSKRYDHEIHMSLDIQQR